MTMTPSQAKNAIFKALLEIVDPPLKPSEERRIRAFFENRCAYCNREIPVEGRTGHIDHLIPRQQGGTNHPSNLVLACNICNGDEKLDQGWREFINYKIQDPTQRQKRIDRIGAWISREGGPILIPGQAQAIIREAHSKVVQALDLEINKLKQMRSNKALHRIADKSGSR
jgi:hypothetical protein